MNTVTKSVKVQLTTDLLGTIPMNKEIYSTYIESLRPVEKNEEGEPEVENVEEREERGWTTFMKDENGFFVYDYYIKGFFKHAATVLKEDLGIKNLRSKISDLLFVSPRIIYLDCKIPDLVVERSLRAQTAQGPRITLAKSDAIKAGKIISFDVTVFVGKGELKGEIVGKLLEYGAFQGFGQFRNGGYGRFEVISVK
jgi:hypothetical protein